MTPFMLKPGLQDYIWGGTRLKDEWGKQTDKAIIAESWELSAQAHCSSVIHTGPLAGMPFTEFCQRYPEAMGTQSTADIFPILIKLIDARQALSVQVHPDDRYAARVENGLGKTEVWIVLDSEPGASLYFGVKEDTTREELERRIADNTLTDILRSVPARPGDVFFIPAGTIHAIGARLLIAEVQQNSNTTYRVYDYGRIGADGNPRELHVEKALDVSTLSPTPLQCPGAATLADTAEYTLRRLIACPYFTVDRLDLRGRYAGKTTSRSFLHLLCVDGEAELCSGGETLLLKKGDSAFLPAQEAEFSLTGEAELLCSGV